MIGIYFSRWKWGFIVIWLIYCKYSAYFGQFVDVSSEVSRWQWRQCFHKNRVELPYFARKYNYKSFSSLFGPKTFLLAYTDIYMYINKITKCIWKTTWNPNYHDGFHKEIKKNIPPGTSPSGQWASPTPALRQTPPISRSQDTDAERRKM